MRARWISVAFEVVIWISVVTLVSARVCILGTEPDEAAGGRVRFVLPPGDPCSCAEVKLGGHNAYAPPRKDQPIYIDTLPTDAEELRRLLSCMDVNSQVDEVSAEISQSTATSTLASVINPTTTEIPAYSDCQAAQDAGHTTSGVYAIYHGEESMEAYCDMDTSGIGYIVIQRRINGSVDFNRSWEEYRQGFGDLEGEFWWGNEKLRTLTEIDARDWELVVTLKAFDGREARVRYHKFVIKEVDRYEIDTDAYDFEEAGDALESSKPFSTKDRDYDDDDKDMNCAEFFGGGWWYDHCDDSKSNLNGVYSNEVTVEAYHGIYWRTWKGETESLKGCEMKIRINPKS